MRFIITKLDGRYSESMYFKYRIEFQANVWGYDRYQLLAQQNQEMLEWFWESFGPGCERDAYKHIAFKENRVTRIPERQENAPRWAWYYDSKERIPYIYVTDQATLAHLQLKWAA